MAASVTVSANDGKSAKGTVQNGSRPLEWVATKSSKTGNCWNVTLLGNLNGISGQRRQTLQALVMKEL